MTGGGDDAPCVPQGSPGNSKGVGKWCSKGGLQCNLFSFASFCTVDFADGAPAFCTNQCSTDSDCGEDAACTTDGSGRYGCTPTACLPKPDAGAPTPPPPSTPDAGTSDACLKLANCCAAAEFPAHNLSVCMDTLQEGSDTLCKIAREGYELVDDCPAQP
jgi:hypothetical protein